MFGVGIWGAQMGGRRIWSLPMSFPLIMCVGALIAITKVYSFVFVEQIIALSVIVLGFVVFFKWSPNELIAIIIISVFALFHGYAHGYELPKANDPISFIIGFVLSTGLIHLFGIGIGCIFNKFHNKNIFKLWCFQSIFGIAFYLKRIFNSEKIFYLYFNKMIVIISKLFFMPSSEYGLFESGMYNIFNNYLLLLCLLGLALLLLNTKKNMTHLYFFLTFIFFSQ